MQSMDIVNLEDTAHGSVKDVRLVGVPMETAPLIEAVIDDMDVVEALYRSDVWAKNGIELLDFGGGEFGITVNMVLELPIEELKKVSFGKRTLGLRRAKKLHEICKAAMSLEPYY